METHYKFISAENITILSISSDDFLHASLEVAECTHTNIHTHPYIHTYMYIYIKH